MAVRRNDNRVCLGGGCNCLCAASENLTAVLVDAHVQVAELKDIGLCGVELERYKPHRCRRRLGWGNVLKAGSVSQAAVYLNEEVLRLVHRGFVLVDIDARSNGVADLPAGQVCLNNLDHQALALIQSASGMAGSIPSLASLAHAAFSTRVACWNSMSAIVGSPVRGRAIRAPKT